MACGDGGLGRRVACDDGGLSRRCRGGAQGLQNVYFAPSQEVERLQNQAVRHTKLTQFFALNATNVAARQYLYHDIPTHYTWQVLAGKKSRKCQTMVSAADSDGKRYIGSDVHSEPTGPGPFPLETATSEPKRPAVLSRHKDGGRSRSRNIHGGCGCTRTIGRRLSVAGLFDGIGDPSNTLALYEANEANLMEDFDRRLQDIDRARAACLATIEDLLCAHGKSIVDYDLPLADPCLLEPLQDDALFREIDAAARWAPRVDALNAEQRTLYDRVIADVDDQREVSRTFFVDGPGGTGKITLYGCLIWSLRHRPQPREVLCVAFTGIAASLMDGGMTVHSTFGLPFGTLTEDSTSNITMQSERAQKIRNAALIVWDEAPMSPGLQLTVVDRLLRDVMVSELPFGGKTMLFTGDFRQILPVIRRGTRADIVMSSIKNNGLWSVMERFNLVQNMRVGNDADFASWLLQLGNGQLPAVDGVPDTVQIPRKMVCDVADLIDFVYPQQISLANVEEFARRVVVCPTNEGVNGDVLERVDGNPKTYEAVDTMMANEADEVAHRVPQQFGTGRPAAVPADVEVGVHRDVAQKSRSEEPTVQRYEDDDIVVPKIPLTSSGEDDLPISLRHLQFPVRLSFAMTINKSQLFYMCPMFKDDDDSLAAARLPSSLRLDYCCPSENNLFY
ncbi:ATP-dependent DNA helicase PIF1-like [Metopolophium dirhodum]|uniref:ATP-dependent DNA helicase PIF1-like n=1 Tax=Metopolophium dirhodum TaxID=44670 RepID=UPI00298F8297|nr:ATP-dependent DNA helicase PIF1-like [Metopolophium dirhodum]